MTSGNHTVEKIGGSSMSDYRSVRDNIILGGRGSRELYRRIFVVSAYGGITDRLLECKRSGRPGVFALFSGARDEHSWQDALGELRQVMFDINGKLFGDDILCGRANAFIDERLDHARRCLVGLEDICAHGHFSLAGHLATVREMLASLGEAHSAWNLVQLLRRDGVNARLVDLTGWQATGAVPLDEHIGLAFADVDLGAELPVVTGYAHCTEGLMSTFDRGYSEMTFSRIAVLTGAHEAVIHKEFHLSSADPRLVGASHAVPIGRTNYDVADQLANLGMEAIHPRAAKGLRRSGIALRVKNTFQPDHPGTLITADYVSRKPCVEIIAGRKDVYAIEVFDQDMAGEIDRHEAGILAVLQRFRAQVVAKDINANTVTHYLATNLKTVRRVRRVLEEQFPEAEIDQQKVAIVSAVGSDMKVPGILASTAAVLAEQNISVLAIHQSMRQVDMQFVVREEDYDQAVKSLHRCLVEAHDHGEAISLAS